VEERRLATWGTEVPEDLVLDEKLLAEALRKVNTLLNQLGNY
jgi:pre-mRNA-processing factor SLU7